MRSTQSSGDGMSGAARVMPGSATSLAGTARSVSTAATVSRAAPSWVSVPATFVARRPARTTVAAISPSACRRAPGAGSGRSPKPDPGGRRCRPSPAAPAGPRTPRWGWCRCSTPRTTGWCDRAQRGGLRSRRRTDPSVHHGSRPVRPGSGYIVAPTPGLPGCADVAQLVVRNLAKVEVAGFESRHPLHTTKGPGHGPGPFVVPDVGRTPVASAMERVYGRIMTASAEDDSRNASPSSSAS